MAGSLILFATIIIILKACYAKQCLDILLQSTMQRFSFFLAVGRLHIFILLLYLVCLDFNFNPFLETILVLTGDIN